MKIKIEKLSLESLVALERERERERESYSLRGEKNLYKLTYDNENEILNKINIKLFSSMFFLCTKNTY